MDAVYITRPGPDQDELRCSLRSLANLAGIDNVWTVGHRPDWYRGRHIDGNRAGTKAQNIYWNWRIACDHDQISDTFVAFCDDEYVIRPTTPQVERCKRDLAALLAAQGNPNGWWARSLRSTLQYCRAAGLSTYGYELHRPALVDKAKLGQALAEAVDWNPIEPPQWRSVYGNRWHISGTVVRDVKLGVVPELPAWVEHEPYLSSSDASFRTGAVGSYVRALFTTPSSWEKTRAGIAA